MSSPVVPVSDPSDDARARIIASTVTCTLVALVVLSIRNYVRIRIVRSYGWDVG